MAGRSDGPTVSSHSSSRVATRSRAGRTTSPVRSATRRLGERVVCLPASVEAALHPLAPASHSRVGREVDDIRPSDSSTKHSSPHARPPTTASGEGKRIFRDHLVITRAESESGAIAKVGLTRASGVGREGLEPPTPCASYEAQSSAYPCGSPNAVEQGFRASTSHRDSSRPAYGVHSVIIAAKAR